MGSKWTPLSQFTLVKFTLRKDLYFMCLTQIVLSFRRSSQVARFFQSRLKIYHLLCHILTYINYIIVNLLFTENFNLTFLKPENLSNKLNSIICCIDLYPASPSRFIIVRFSSARFFQIFYRYLINFFFHFGPGIHCLRCQSHMSPTNFE